VLAARSASDMSIGVPVSRKCGSSRMSLTTNPNESAESKDPSAGAVPGDMDLSNRFTLALVPCLLALLLSPGCTSRSRRSDSPIRVRDGGAPVSDPSCPGPEAIVPEITCGHERPDVLCAGSCAQTLDGIVGVGLSSCRCIDQGTGFGGQWICDTTGCEGPPVADAGVPDERDAGSPPPPDAGVCPPATVARPTTPGCTTSQRYEIMSIETQADYDAFVANPANTDCNNCLSQSALACGTSHGCDGSAGELLCCLEDNCGEDDTCRNAAFTGVCATEANGLTRCVSGISACALIPPTPPAECFP